MKTRTLEKVLPPPPAHMVGDGFKVHNFFPGGSGIASRRMSPFFLLDYGAKTHIPPGDRPRGVGAHPHRGFETVTVAYHGSVAHHDSAGNRGVIGPGDVQWMTAGSGVLHKEYHEEAFSRAGGTMQMAQIWVNLPAAYKMTAPRYQELTRRGMGLHELPDGSGQVEVIAGEFGGAKGPAATFTPIHLYNVRLKSGAAIELPLPESFNAGILVVEGSLVFEGSEKAPADHFVLLGNDGDAVSVKADQDSVFLVLAGEPIDEPLAAYGPFLMNTQREIMQAIEDFNGGRFGSLDG